jgi:hypothetical protein
VEPEIRKTSRKDELVDVNEARAQAEAALKVEWSPVSVKAGHETCLGDTGRVVLRRTDHLQADKEARLVQAAFEHLARHEDTMRRLEGMGWTVGEIRFSLRQAEVVKVKDGKAVVDPMPPSLWVEATAEVEGHEVTYSLQPDGTEWSHSVYGVGEIDGVTFGVEHGADRRAPAPHVMSPKVALRLLIEARQRALDYALSEVYRYLLAQCGPAEEPDPEEVENLAEKCAFYGVNVSRLLDMEPVSPAGPDAVFVVERPGG